MQICLELQRKLHRGGAAEAMAPLCHKRENAPRPRNYKYVNIAGAQVFGSGREQSSVDRLNEPSNDVQALLEADYPLHMIGVHKSL